MLNDLFCFFLIVGHFDEVTPPEALSRKRDLDRIFHAHAPLFSAEFRDTYQRFIDACFLAFTGEARPAELRASREAQKRERSTWDDDWERHVRPGRTGACPDDRRRLTTT
jgi:hypothetical protein